MRIISGKYRGRKIDSPFGNTMPTSERVREAVFSILDWDIKGARVLDLFSGSGSIGLEFLSRGASFVHFNELNGRNVQNIKKMAEVFGCSGQAEVTKLDFRRLLRLFQNEKFDIIYIDPPFEMGMEEETMELLAEVDLLAEGGKIVTETKLKLKETYGPYQQVDLRTYGKIFISIYERETE